MKERGKFVVVEGGLASGKSTVIRGLREDLVGWNYYREPGGTHFGEKVRDAVQGLHDYHVDKYASLFAYTSSRANLVRGVIIPELEQGKNIFLDRYWYSSFAYQGAEGISKLLIGAINIVATKGLKPNLVLHYDLKPEIGIKRKEDKTDLDRYDLKNIEFQNIVRKNYFMLKRIYPIIWKSIDASNSREEVLRDSKMALKEHGLI